MNAATRRKKTEVGDEAAAPMHRSAAVARLLQMPVATLRVWERRYALTDPVLKPGGQRLYAPADIRRLALLKRLTEAGHAIGSLARLNMAQLEAVASTQAQALAAARSGRRPKSSQADVRAWRLVLVGAALAVRLQRPALLRQFGRPLQIVGPFDDLAQATAALAAPAGDGVVDAWLVHQTQLHADWPAQLASAVHGRTAAAEPPVAVLYSYAADAVCEALAARGVALLREPQPDVALAQWLKLWARTPVPPGPEALPVGAGPAPRRWSDAALDKFVSRTSSVACECPRHVAELLMQLARFEAYSAQCEQRSPQDAELHALLCRVAADARASFEDALVQVALREGLPMPDAAA